VGRLSRLVWGLHLAFAVLSAGEVAALSVLFADWFGLDIARADVICTVTSSAEPVLLGEWVKPGTHINLVGSSYVGPVEVDTALVANARYIADYRPGVIAQSAELAVAREAGAIDDTHVVGEIGEVLAGRIPGRQNDEQITIYKSLGHVVQDLAAVAYLRSRSAAA